MAETLWLNGGDAAMMSVSSVMMRNDKIMPECGNRTYLRNRFDREFASWSAEVWCCLSVSITRLRD
jgi:hypothetical protein